MPDDIYLALDDENAGDAVIKNDEGDCFELVGNSITSADTYSVDSHLDCDDCLTTCIAPIPDLFATFALNVDTCGACNCADLPENIVLEYQGASVWNWNNGKYLVEVTDNGLAWEMNVTCIADVGNCGTYEKPYGACPYPDLAEVWEVVAAGPCVNQVVIVIFIPPAPVPSPVPCVPCDCSVATVVISGFTGDFFCNSCLCNTFNGTYVLDNGTGVNENSKVGILSCVNDTWYFTAQCPSNFNCVQFTAPNTNDCPPENGWVKVGDPFKGCNFSDGVAGAMSLTTERCPACVWIFFGEWDCDTSTGTVTTNQLVGCVDPTEYVFDTWIFEEQTGPPNKCKFKRYVRAEDCTDTCNAVAPANPPVPTIGVCAC